MSARGPRRLCAALAIAAAMISRATPVTAAAARPAPPLLRPSGKIVRVSTEPELQAAVASLASNSTVLVTPGIYRLTKTLYVKGTMAAVSLRGSTDRADDVVIVGPGMTNSSYGEVPYGIWTGGDIRGITIANLTLRDFYLHPIILNPGTVSPHLYNLRLVNAGQQFVKANPIATGAGVDNGVVEYSVIEYDTRSKDDYTNGIDVHGGHHWVIRHNLFRNIRAPRGLAGPAILMWNGATDSTVDGNTFVNCQREIAFGLTDRAPYDHRGGVVRNNFIYRDPSVNGDVAIGVFASPETQVLHNTVLISGSYPNAIEARFSSARNIAIRDNLLDRAVRNRDGSTAMSVENVTTATAALFVNPPAGDLHLVRPAAASVHHGVATADCPVDWDGDRRPSGATTDVGADAPAADPMASGRRGSSPAS